MDSRSATDETRAGGVDRVAVEDATTASRLVIAAIVLGCLSYAAAAIWVIATYHPVAEDYFPHHYFSPQTGDFLWRHWLSDFYGAFSMGAGQNGYRPLTSTWWVSLHLLWPRQYAMQAAQTIALWLLIVFATARLGGALTRDRLIGWMSGVLLLTAPWAAGGWAWPGACADLLAALFLLMNLLFIVEGYRRGGRGGRWRVMFFAPLMLAGALACKEGALSHIGASVLFVAWHEWRDASILRSADNAATPPRGWVFLRPTAIVSAPFLFWFALYLLFRRVRFGSLFDLYPLDPGAQLDGVSQVTRGLEPLLTILFGGSGMFSEVVIPGAIRVSVRWLTIAIIVLGAITSLSFGRDAGEARCLSALLLISTLLVAVPQLPRLDSPPLAFGSRFEAIGFMPMMAILLAVWLTPATNPRAAALSKLRGGLLMVVVAIQGAALLTSISVAAQAFDWGRRLHGAVEDLPATVIDEESGGQRAATYHVRDVPLYHYGWSVFRVPTVSLPPFSDAPRFPDPIDPDFHVFVPFDRAAPPVVLDDFSAWESASASVMLARADRGREFGTTSNPATAFRFPESNATSANELLAVRVTASSPPDGHVLVYVAATLGNHPLSTAVLHAYLWPEQPSDVVFFPAETMLRELGVDRFQDVFIGLRPLGLHARDVELTIEDVFLVQRPRP